MAKRTTGFHFEQALSELEAVVEHLESGELSLEESLQHFERGIALTRACQKSLAEAEQRVKILMETDGRERLAPFEPPGPDPT
ncbi:MAG: exodeoxyribonuclease VII small subunit [Gammaproteobacteria bacterium]